jgi:hypothetical protein
MNMSLKKPLHALLMASAVVLLSLALSGCQTCCFLCCGSNVVDRPPELGGPSRGGGDDEFAQSNNTLPGAPATAMAF